MTDPDFNLLPALDALLSEESVAGAARRLGLSASAMSRTLARLRTVTGDPLLVKAGRKMVLTPHAENMRDRTRQAIFEARSILMPSVSGLDLKVLDKTFTLRTNEGFIAAFGSALVTEVEKMAPNANLHFVYKSEKNSLGLREGNIDLEIGVLKNMGPEINTQALFRDRFIGVVRKGHLLENEKVITPQLYASCRHVSTSRHGNGEGPLDEVLAIYGLVRNIAVVVPDVAASLAIAGQSDLVALVPALSVIHILRMNEHYPPLYAFELPVRTPEITVSQMWHPRQKRNPAHQWLRQLVLAVCRQKAAELHHSAQTLIKVAP